MLEIDIGCIAALSCGRPGMTGWSWAMGVGRGARDVAAPHPDLQTYPRISGLAYSRCFLSARVVFARRAEGEGRRRYLTSGAVIARWCPEREARQNPDQSLNELRDRKDTSQRFGTCGLTFASPLAQPSSNSEAGLRTATRRTSGVGSDDGSGKPPRLAPANAKISSEGAARLPY
jgi:hypothetical protein